MSIAYAYLIKDMMENATIVYFINLLTLYCFLLAILDILFTNEKNDNYITNYSFNLKFILRLKYLIYK